VPKVLVPYSGQSSSGDSPTEQTLNDQAPLTMSTKGALLTADYVAPSGTHKFSHELPSASANNVTDKTAYLSALRSKNTELQAEINAFLTQKMEEDVKAAEGRPTKRSKKEEREEEMYGEEDPEADD
jgi:hypothetical protein